MTEAGHPNQRRDANNALGDEVGGDSFSNESCDGTKWWSLILDNGSLIVTNSARIRRFFKEQHSNEECKPLSVVWASEGEALQIAETTKFSRIVLYRKDPENGRVTKENVPK